MLLCGALDWGLLLRDALDWGLCCYLMLCCCAMFWGTVLLCDVLGDCVAM